MSFGAELRGYYAVVDLDEGDGLALASTLIDGGASVVQLRMKRAPTRALYVAASALRALTRARGVPFIVNDRLDVALAVGADGVHLGQEDLPLAAARAACAAVGTRLVIGVSTHTPAQAETWARAGADYLGFGPVFATMTKEHADPVQGVEALAEAVRRTQVPIVAIGGITPENVAEVARAGAAAACAISSVNGAVDVVAAARRIVAAFRS